MNKVEIQFKDRAIIRRGIFMFSKDDAFSFIDQCEKELLCKKDKRGAAKML